MKNKYSVIGGNVIREDGIEKVTGYAKFADDYKFDGMLHSAMLRIPETHAKINSIDFSKIEKNKSIAAVCTSADISGARKIGVIKNDQPVFCNEKVVTPGDVLAMLVGESEYELKKLLSEIKVDYTPMPVLTDPRKSLEPGSILIHEEADSN